MGSPNLKNLGAYSTNHLGSIVVTSRMYSFVVITNSWYTTLKCERKSSAKFTLLPEVKRFSNMTRNELLRYLERKYLEGSARPRNTLQKGLKIPCARTTIRTYTLPNCQFIIFYLLPINELRRRILTTSLSYLKGPSSSKPSFHSFNTGASCFTSNSQLHFKILPPVATYKG